MNEFENETLIIIFLLLCVNIFSQTSPGWNALDTTVIPIHSSSGEKIALFANHYGVHLLKIEYVGTQRNVRYYRLKTTGDLDSGFTSAGIVLDDSSDHPNIVGDENKLYAVYKRFNKIKIKASTNGGTNWSTDSLILQNGNVLCNGVDAAYSVFGGLHVVWSEEIVNNKYESYFNRFISNSWTGTVLITNTTPIDTGGFPTVTTSTVSGVDRAHVSINTGGGDVIGDNSGKSYSRDFNYSTWASPIAIVSSVYSKIDRLIVIGSYLHSFYYTTDTPLPKLKYKRKLVTSSVWTDSSEINNSVSYTGHLHDVNITKTNGDTLHVIWHGGGGNIYYSKKYNTSNSWSSPFEVEGGVSQWDCAITSSSNDLFFMSTKVGNNYRYRQYDANPLTPANFAISTYIGVESGYPKLDWSLNNEPDVRIATRGYLIERRLDQLGDGTWSAWSQIDSIAGSTNTYIDYTLSGAGSGANIAEYRIRAQDKTWHRSNYTSALQIDYGTGYWKVVSNTLSNDIPEDFSITQNYPNPFNPSTNITYAIPEDAKVQIKIYDMLGTEVAELVNETKPAGYYETIFDASDLSSGMYIFRITALNGGGILFSQSKQMILLK